eukprot:6192811-Pleurochrysis_carterae.AAC.5
MRTGSIAALQPGDPPLVVSRLLPVARERAALPSSEGERAAWRRRARSCVARIALSRQCCRNIY